MILLGTSDADIARAGRAIREGLLVAIPTETVYGLGANALDPRALARVFEAKDRPRFDPLILHVAEPSQADGIAFFPDGPARSLAGAFWPGPLTLVLPKRGHIPDLATSGLATVAVRCPAHDVARAVIRAAGVPVAAPSANPFGRLSPTRAEHVAGQLGNRVDFIVDGGQCSIGVESTVLDCSESPPLVLRPGGLSLERLRSVAPDIEVFDRTGESPRAPGQFPSHYAPLAPLHLVDRGSLADVVPAEGAVALTFGAACHEAVRAAGRFRELRCLSEAGDPLEAAARLFDVLHGLDAAGATEIWAERLPDAGLGLAVNDRLRKASKR